VNRPQRIMFGEMREMGVRGLLYCSDFRCSHSVAINGGRWPDHVRLSDLEPLFVCEACGTRPAISGRTSIGIRLNPETSSARSQLITFNLQNKVYIHWTARYLIYRRSA
jgi:hypothetical protein